MTDRFEWVRPGRDVLDNVTSDVLVLAACSDDRPLRGLTGLVDWRLCGAMSRWCRSGFATGALGERVLYPARKRTSHTYVLLFGLGRREQLRADRCLAVASAAVAAAIGLQARTLSCGLFGLDELPSLLERTGRQLLDVLDDDRLARVHVIADEASQAAVIKGVTRAQR